MYFSPKTYTDWLTRLVQIPSVNTSQAGPRAGTPGEGQIAQQVAAWFSDFGGQVELEDALPGRPNVYARWQGRSDRWVAFDVHLDTVGVEHMDGDPFDGRVADGRVYGRGSVDSKASLAVMLTLLETMHKNGWQPEPNLLVVCTADEEVSLAGAWQFAKWVRTQGIQIEQLMVAEPTHCAPVNGHGGDVRMVVDVHGHAAHSSQPELGQSAINSAAQIILALAEEHKRLQLESPQSLPGNNRTINVGYINGGAWFNLVAPHCRLGVERRLVWQEDYRTVMAELSDLITAHSTVPVEITFQGETAPFYQPADTPWLTQLIEWSGQRPQIVSYNTNASAYNGLARETVIFGPGSVEQAHKAVEWVAISELEKVARIYQHWLGLV